MVKSFGLLVLTLVLLGGCASNKDQDAINQAQACLDKVPQSDPTQADNCMQYVSTIDSQAANILKCSIVMTSGGLVENKVILAYNALKDGSQTNKAATFMATLSLNLPTVDQAYTKALAANAYCGQSGVSGLKYISSLIVAGTALSQTLAHLTSGAGAGAGFDISNPAAVNAAVQNVVAACSGASPDPACTANLPAIGGAVMSIATSYCSQSGADQTVCSQVTPAVNAANGDPNLVAQAILCYMRNTTFNTSTQACN